MTERKRRGRTGCLTCRARRIKCDERKPTCKRCETGNLACAGYEPQRCIAPPSGRRHRIAASLEAKAESPNGAPGQTKHGSTSPHPHGGSGMPVPSPQPCIRADGLPLIGLPSNPGSSQRPCARARDVLAYHQFLFRTLPVIFPQSHVPYWRDQLCQEAWGTEYLYLAIIALGGIHRATLMLYMPGENDRARGWDTKVLALQTHAVALKELANELREAEGRPAILTGALVLMAYFEAFAGNPLAMMGHVQHAAHYISLVSAEKPEHEPLRIALTRLERLCRAVLPVQSVGTTEDQNILAIKSATKELLPRYAIADALDDLTRIITSDGDIENLIWTPLAPYTNPLHTDEIRKLQEALKSWKARHPQPKSILESDLFIPGLSRSALDNFFRTPEPYTNLTPRDCLAGALFNFCMGRADWALAVQGEDADASELSAYHFFYETLTFIESYMDKYMHPSTEADKPFLPCEVQGYGYLPILHIIGQCSPNAAWLRWIMQSACKIGHEGVFNARAIATSLEVLQTFELLDGADSSPTLQRFPAPDARIVSVLVPETSSKGYLCYYARPKAQADIGREKSFGFSPLGHARWQAGPHHIDAKPRVEIHRGDFTENGEAGLSWPLGYPLISEWQSRLVPALFDFDRALQDHITWSDVFPAASLWEESQQ